MLIKCFDNWDDWKSIDQRLLGNCLLSSDETVTMYKYAPIENELTHYWMGNDTYMENYCWPGPTPLYSNWMKFPDNPIWAFINTIKAVQKDWFMAAYMGLPSNNPAFKGPINRRPWSEILSESKALFTEYMDSVMKDLYTKNMQSKPSS